MNLRTRRSSAYMSHHERDREGAKGGQHERDPAGVAVAPANSSSIISRASGGPVTSRTVASGPGSTFS